MTDTTADHSAWRPKNLAPLLFAVAIFTSASLVFVVQPMVAKLVLPMLGGSPSVWNTSMVFFQTALLAGYAYAHGLQKVNSIRAQVLTHVALLLIAGSFLPLAVSGVLGDPDPARPVMWLLGTLALSVGAPFAILSATAPLLQAWYARVRADHADGGNPYVLYAASNLGSFLALLAYPLLIEPLMTLSGQRISWTVGYGLFLVIVVLLAVMVWPQGSQPTLHAEKTDRSAPISWTQKILLVLLAAAPSSLMLGVTTHLSTDVASAPFLWVVPLALYLLTFVIAFSAKPAIPLWVTLTVQGAAAAACASVIGFNTGEWLLLFGVHLATFFFTALMCHQLMAARRPAPDRLTEFYLLLSVGGVLGGAFNALIAPVIFNMVWEYPLVLVLAGLARPWGGDRYSLREVALLGAIAVVAVAPPVVLEIVRYDADLRTKIGDVAMVQIAQIVLGLGAVLAFLLRDRALLFTLSLALITGSAHFLSRGYDWSLSERSFFGVMRVAAAPEPRMGGAMNILMHGTTLHGAQAQAPEYACTPTMYYARSTPIGQAARLIQARGPSATIGVIGQGSGAMAAYKRAGDDLTFFEIDPMVDRLSRDPRWFSYISGCAQGPVKTVLGDARLTLEREPDGKYDLLIVDAFSSDAVPTHLLTQEALQGYLRVVKPDGVVLLHLSNRNLEITLPAVAAARALGAADQHQVYLKSGDAPDMAEASTEALAISPTQDGLADFRADPRWRTLAPTTVRPWTDDYVNLFGAMLRNMRGG